MKLYQKYREIINEIKPIQVAWFTTFNVDAELVEKYLLSYIAGIEPSELKTAEDYEALNLDLADKNINIWYDFRALNLKSAKRTCVDFIPVAPSMVFNNKSESSIFHPKVIFLKGEKGAYLIAGSANLSFSAWSSNKESVLIKKIESVNNAKQIIGFFRQLGARDKSFNRWKNSLSEENTNWNFVYRAKDKFYLFDYLKKDKLIIWAPYFSKKTIQLLMQITGLGYEHITLVPSINESGKISIKEDEVKLLLESQNISIKRPTKIDEAQGLHHAKVWLTEDSLAVGSWNCSHRATGLGINNKEANIEAGIVVNIEKTKVADVLIGNIVDFDNVEHIKGQTEEDLDEEWEQVLNDFKVSVEIIANWETFKYSIKLNDKLKSHDYFVSLPHKPNEKIKLSSVDGLPFRNEYVRVLKNKFFLVYDNNDNVVFNGYIQEIEKRFRPVYGYVNLDDLFESLIDNPAGSTENKKCLYILPHEDDSLAKKNNKLKYNDSGSYYIMFVSFQKLYDKIDEFKNKLNELDRLGFRLPGSLLNIKQLVEEYLNREEKQGERGDLMYKYFLVLELNRCIRLFNQFSEDKITEVQRVKEIHDKLKLGRKDTTFLKSLKKEFGYEFI